MIHKIRFRELNEGDWHKLYEIYSDKEAMKYRGSKAMESIEDAKTYVDNKSVLDGPVLTTRKAVELLATEELIGSVMYRYDDRKKEACEIGYSIGRQYWRQGLGEAIVRKLLQTIEENKAIKYIIAWSNKENIASIKILEKTGFLFIKQDETQSYCLYKKENVQKL